MRGFVSKGTVEGVVGFTEFKYIHISLCPVMKFSRKRETSLYKMYLYGTGYNIGTDLLKPWKNIRLRKQMAESRLRKWQLKGNRV